MVKDNSDSERGNLLPPHGLLFPINSKGSFICTIPDRITHTCYTSHGALAGTRNRSMGQLPEGSIRRPIAPWANALTTDLHLAPPTWGYRTITEQTQHHWHGGKHLLWMLIEATVPVTKSQTIMNSIWLIMA